MAFSKLVLAASVPLFVVLAMTLSGCAVTEISNSLMDTAKGLLDGMNTTEPNSSTTAPDTSTLSADAQGSLVAWANWSSPDFPTECFHMGMADIGKKVDDKCCAAPGAVSPMVTEKDGTAYDCFPVDLGGIYARDFFGCDDGEVTVAEGCTPAGYEVLNLSSPDGWPTSDGSSLWEGTGTPSSCYCGYSNYAAVTSMTGYSAGFPSVYKGPGCFVALNYLHMYVPFMGMNASTAKSTLEAYSYNFAFFAHIEGSCQ
mmetsp:Transcript_18451/g.32320  ORF Transcript_18451/g.32320 Transcript_18451/m.32320 type:complete len:256 (+) Transcript_18451:70-837(+)